MKDASIRVRPPEDPHTVQVQVGCVIHAEITPFPGKSKYTLMDGHIRCWGRVALATWSSNGPDDAEGQLWVQSNSNTTTPLGSRFHADTLEAMNAIELLLFPIFLFPIAADSRILTLALEQDKKDPATYRRIGIFEVNSSERRNLGAACEYLTNMLHSKSNEISLEPTLHDDISVLIGNDIGYLKNQHSVKGVSFTVK